MTGVMRVPAASGGRCWMCGMPAVSGEKLPGRRHRVRLLCKRHDVLVFGGARDTPGSSSGDDAPSSRK
ncbi:hypothetical protein SAMN05216188_13044 [Lentzea xinjiangensis]|uniref:Uncharacterized protein n=2 Tax=Lentzea xinjiangensis TaxID=402600 RepID=A0A1H9W316_9PSEU|nr:hypothetical protein SAMN05216188_13044 [Lentzea xinjiangensis]